MLVPDVDSRFQLAIVCGQNEVLQAVTLPDCQLPLMQARWPMHILNAVHASSCGHMSLTI